MIASGMLIGGDDIPVAYDRFRHRVMFPIADLRAASSPSAGARSIPMRRRNTSTRPTRRSSTRARSCSTRTARAGRRTTRSRVIAVEGYMDVIALTEAGFGETVAPLGTALTEEQVKLLWRMSAEPILCFDGDAAGRKAAFRAVETALPLLKPGFSVRFAFLPDGLDPDDLVRQQGAAGLRRRARQDARPVRRSVGARVRRSRICRRRSSARPSRRGSRRIVGKIGDAAVRSHYERELRETPVGAQPDRGTRDRPRARAAPGRGGSTTAQQCCARLAHPRARPGLAPRAQAAPQRRQTASPELAARTESRPGARGPAHQNPAQSPVAASMSTPRRSRT